MIYHGDKKIAKIFHGDREISRIYREDKLVFQNKLIPGVDYERFKWLVGNGYIFTYLESKLIRGFEVKFHSHELTRFDINARVWGNRGSQTYTYGLSASTTQSGYQVFTPIPLKYATYLKKEDELEINSHKCEVGGATTLNNIICNENTQPISQEGFVSINAAAGASNTYMNFYSADFYNVQGIKILALKPVKLLRNIAASVSADNKPHPAGECGMIDEISGKFYGNANSVGAFSVSND